MKCIRLPAIPGAATVDPQVEPIVGAGSRAGTSRLAFWVCGLALVLGSSGSAQMTVGSDVTLEDILRERRSLVIEGAGVSANGTQENSCGVRAIMSISADGAYAPRAGSADDRVPERTHRAWYERSAGSLATL